jgi:hypothetical protein
MKQVAGLDVADPAVEVLAVVVPAAVGGQRRRIGKHQVVMGAASAGVTTAAA